MSKLAIAKDFRCAVIKGAAYVATADAVDLVEQFEFGEPSVGGIAPIGLQCRREHNHVRWRRGRWERETAANSKKKPPCCEAEGGLSGGGGN